MADLKISQLPSATTPLAGTEVLPIVQSNATKQVSIANLTAGRSVSVADATLTTGNLVIGTSGKGIDFSATGQAGGMTSELLNDYEEGFTTPVTVTPYTSGTITLDPSFSTLAYTKIGRKISVTGNLTVSSVDTPVGAYFSISSLPFARGGYRSFDTSPSITVLGANTASPYQFYGFISAGLAQTLYVAGGLGAAELKAGSEILLSIEYFI